MKNIIYDRTTVEQFLKFSTELFNQGIPHNGLVSAKSASEKILRTKYQSIPQYQAVIKYFKGTFNLRAPLPKLSFVWDTQIMIEYLSDLEGNSQILNKHFPQKLLILLLLRKGQRLSSTSFYN